MRAGIRQCLAASAGAGLMMMSAMMASAHGATAHSAETQAAGENGSQQALQMVGARAELKDSINAKKVKQGQTIRAQLEDRVKLSNGDVLERNTILQGHVDQVQASEKKSDSTVVVTFDKALVKGGEALPIKATVLLIWEAVSNPMAGGGSPGPPMPGQPMEAPSGGTTGGSQPTPMNAPEGGPGSSVPGVTLHSDVHEKSSVTFTAKRENVDVPGGTQMQFELVVIPKGVQFQ